MTSPPTGHPPAGQRLGLAATVGLYVLARLGLVAIVTALMLLTGTPFLIALLIGMIVALPLSMVLFRGLRTRLDTAVSESRSRRSRERSALRARLRGEGELPGSPTSGDLPERQPDSRED
jgi:membrane protein implicated in regulation of membrane protease activity